MIAWTALDWTIMVGYGVTAGLVAVALTVALVELVMRQWRRKR